MKLIYLLSLLTISSTVFAGCAKQQEVTQEAIQNTDSIKLKIKVGRTVFTSTLNDNATVAAFKAMLPLTLEMSELNGNENYCDFATNLPTGATNPGAINSGDIIFWQSNTLALFYKPFSTSYNYTRLGKIEDPNGRAEALGKGDVNVKFDLQR